MDRNFKDILKPRYHKSVLQVVFGDTDDHAEKGGLQKLGQVNYCRQTTVVVMKMTMIAINHIII